MIHHAVSYFLTKYFQFVAGRACLFVHGASDRIIKEITVITTVIAIIIILMISCRSEKKFP